MMYQSGVAINLLTGVRPPKPLVPVSSPHVDFVIVGQVVRGHAGVQYLGSVNVGHHKAQSLLVECAQVRLQQPPRRYELVGDDAEDNDGKNDDRNFEILIPRLQRLTPLSSP